eukprot:5247-Heterococcus_DN1.PRE.6
MAYRSWSLLAVIHQQCCFFYSRQKYRTALYHMTPVHEAVVYQIVITLSITPLSAVIDCSICACAYGKYTAISKLCCTAIMIASYTSRSYAACTYTVYN